MLHGVEVFTGSSSETDHGALALRLYDRLGDLSGQAHAHNNIAMRLLLQGRWTEPRWSSSAVRPPASRRWATPPTPPTRHTTARTC